MKTGVYVESDGVRVLIEPTDGAAVFAPAIAGEGSTRGPFLDRMGRIASCVIECMGAIDSEKANALAAEKGGAHRTPPTDPPPDQGGAQAPPGGPRANPPRPR